MSSFPLVSIILPTYNRAELLPYAIDSVINQTYKKWELIVWDDGSIDNTAEIVSSYRHEKIRYFHDDNHGMSYALNRAMVETQADFIAFIDDDDIWTERKLESQMDLLAKHTFIDMVFGNYLNINVEQGKKGDGFTQNRKAMSNLQVNKLTGNANVIINNFLHCIAIENFIAFDTVIIRKSVIDTLGIFNDKLRNGMDFEYWWRFGLAEKTPAYTQEILLVRKKYSASLSSPGVESGLNTLKALDICKENSLVEGYPHHLPYLNRSYRNTWQNLITAYGRQKDLPMAFHAFRKSQIYGFRPGSVRLLVEAFFNMARK